MSTAGAVISDLTRLHFVQSNERIALLQGQFHNKKNRTLFVEVKIFCIIKPPIFLMVVFV